MKKIVYILLIFSVISCEKAEQDVGYQNLHLGMPSEMAQEHIESMIETMEKIKDSKNENEKKFLINKHLKEMKIHLNMIKNTFDMAMKKDFSKDHEMGREMKTMHKMLDHLWNQIEERSKYCFKEN